MRVVHFLEACALEVRHAALVDSPVLAALRTGPIVRDDDHHGVVRVTQLFDEGEHPADLLIGVGQEGGEALHEALSQFALALVERLPGWDPRWARREDRALGHDARGELASECLLAPGVPALGETTLVVLDPLRRRMVGRVAGPRGEVQEEGQFVVDGAQVAQIFDGPVGEIRAEVVALVE